MPIPHAPLAPISPNDHAGILWIITILCIVYILMTLLAYIRIKSSHFKVEDYLISLATLTHFSQSVVIFYGLQNGLSKSYHITSEYEWQTSGKTFLASEMLCIISLCLSKCSTFVLIIRVLRPVRFGVDMGWIAIVASILLSVLWGFGSIIGLAAEYDAASLLLPGGNVLQSIIQTHYTRWLAITVVDIITECLGFLIPAILVSILNMPWNDKFHVAFAFSFHLAGAVISASHLSFIAVLSRSPDPQLACTASLSSQQAMLFWSLLASYIPSLRSFLASFNTGMGVKRFEPGNADMEPLGPSYALQTIGGTSISNSTSWQTGNFNSGSKRQNINTRSSALVLRGDQAKHVANVWSDGSATSRPGSQELIIRRDVRWDIQHEQSASE